MTYISIKENFAAKPLKLKHYLYEYLCFEKVYTYKYEHDENILYLYNDVVHYTKCNVRCYVYLILEMGGTKFLEDKQRNE